QGCILSPFLFLLALDLVMCQSIDRQGSSLPWGQIQQLADLDFIDDIALLASTQPALASMTTALKRESAKIRLRISGSKTKIMPVDEY
ncbi:hypothetical protein M9458_037296, partial [Cirrhinus mrigala]